MKWQKANSKNKTNLLNKLKKIRISRQPNNKTLQRRIYQRLNSLDKVLKTMIYILQV